MCLAGRWRRRTSRCSKLAAFLANWRKRPQGAWTPLPERRCLAAMVQAGIMPGVIYTNSLPGQDQPREYTLRRDHPDLEVGGDGKVKEKAKYINPPGRSNLLYFAPYTAPEWLEDTTLPLIITEGPKKCLALSHLAWNGVSDATNKPRWLAV